jgi:phosphoribosylglycinamide formyltransferase-1
MVKIGVLISGSGSNLQSLINSIHKKYIFAQIQVVISDRKNAFGLERAKMENIPAIFLSKKEAGNNDNFNSQLIEILKNYQVDLVVLAGFLSIVNPNFVKTFKNKILNIHPSLIPSFCGDGFYGIKVHESVIKQGVRITGATVHFVDEGTDTGPILLQKSIEVLPNDTAETLQKRVLTLEHELLPLAVKLFCENKIQFIENGKSTKVLVIED